MQEVAGVVVDGRRVRVSHLDRVLWPGTPTGIDSGVESGVGTAVVKAQLVDYYLRIADVLLPHIAGHPVTLHRFPAGVTGPHFFQTRCPPHPDWVRTTTLSYERTGKSFQVAVLDDRPSLVWAANLATIEIHPFLSPADAFEQPKWVVVDLDPGAPAGLVDAAEIALHAREHLVAAGLQPVVKTSGGKGLHVYARVPGGASYDDTKALARTLAGGLEQRFPDRVVSTMAKTRRPGRVLVDWSQNDPGKSTVAPYSLRGLARPTVSTPLAWSEVETLLQTRDPRSVAFTPEDVLDRVARLGDLFAPALA